MTTATVEELQQERNKLHKKLSKIIRAISRLDEENQRIICYRYFEQLKYAEIARRVHVVEKTVHRRIDKSKLAISRLLFGFEDEFFKLIYDV